MMATKLIIEEMIAIIMYAGYGRFKLLFRLIMNAIHARSGERKTDKKARDDPNNRGSREGFDIIV